MIRHAIIIAALAAHAAAPGQTLANAAPTRWTIEAFQNNIPTGPRREAETAARARTIATMLCATLGRADQCRAGLARRSFTSLPANGANQAVWFLDTETNAVGGRKSYVVVTAQRAD